MWRLANTPPIWYCLFWLGLFGLYCAFWYWMESR